LDNRIVYFALLLIAPLKVMTGTVLFTAPPKIAIYFQNIENIEILSKMVLTIPFIAVVFFSPFVRLLVDKFGEKTTFVFALIYLAILGSMTGLLDNIYAILLCRLFFGFGIAVISSLFLVIIGSLIEKKNISIFLGHQRSFTFLGGLFFIFLGGFVSEYSWRYCFFLYLIIFFVVFTTVKFIDLPNTNQEKIKIKIKTITVLKNHGFFYFVAFFLNLLFYMVPTQIPFLLHKIGLEKYISTIFGLDMFAAIFSAFIFGYISKKYSPKQIFIATLFIKAFAYIGFSGSNSLLMFSFFISFSGLASGVLHILLSKWVLDNTNYNNRLQNSSTLTASIYLGLFFSPILFSPLITSFSIEASFFVAGLLFLLSTFFINKYLYVQKS
jgi:MFS family permease